MERGTANMVFPTKNDDRHSLFKVEMTLYV